MDDFFAFPSLKRSSSSSSIRDPADLFNELFENDITAIHEPELMDSQLPSQMPVLSQQELLMRAGGIPYSATEIDSVAAKRRRFDEVDESDFLDSLEFPEQHLDDVPSLSYAAPAIVKTEQKSARSAQKGKKKATTSRIEFASSTTPASPSSSSSGSSTQVEERESTPSMSSPLPMSAKDLRQAKNRDAARLFRARKKTYVQNLEDEVRRQRALLEEQQRELRKLQAMVTVPDSAASRSVENSASASQIDQRVPSSEEQPDAQDLPFELTPQNIYLFFSSRQFTQFLIAFMMFVAITLVFRYKPDSAHDGLEALPLSPFSVSSFSTSPSPQLDTLPGMPNEASASSSTAPDDDMSQATLDSEFDPSSPEFLSPFSQDNLRILRATLSWQFPAWLAVSLALQGKEVPFPKS